MNNIACSTQRLPPVALNGLFGPIVDLYRHVVSPAALLHAFLVAAGTYFGKRSYVRYYGKAVYMAQYAVMIGDASQAYRIAAIVDCFFAPFVEFLLVRRVAAGLSCAQSLILLAPDDIRRPERVNTSKGAPPKLMPTVAYPAQPNKQLLITQPGIVGLLSHNSQGAKSLRHALAATWRGEDLAQSVALRDGAHISASGVHVGLLTSCRPGQLGKLPEEFSSLCLISDLGEWNRQAMFDDTPNDNSSLDAFQGAFADAITAPDTELHLTPEAKTCIFRELEKLPTATRGVTAEKILKNALTYARCSCSTRIELEHAAAATALAEHSAAVQRCVTAHAQADKKNFRVRSKIVAALKNAFPDWVSQTELYRHVLHNHAAADEITAVVDALQREGQIERDVRQTRGRYETIWRLTREA